MEYSLGEALSKIRPADKAADRMARDEDRLSKFKEMYERDADADALAAQQYEQAIGAVDAEKGLLNEFAQEEMQSLIEEKKSYIAEQVKRFGNMSQFMRNGGARLVQKYQNDILNSDAFRKHKKSTAALESVQKMTMQGMGDRISFRTLTEMEDYRNGLIDHFEFRAINPITVPEDKYWEDEEIAAEEILGEQRHQIIGNFLTEFPEKEATETNLLAYTKRYLGPILGARKRARAQAQRAKERAAKNDPLKGKRTMQSANIRDMAIESLENPNISAEPGGLKEWAKNSGWPAGIPFNFNSTSYNAIPTKTDIKLTNAVPMETQVADRVVASFMKENRTENGRYALRLNDVYDERGVFGGGVQTRDDYKSVYKGNGRVEADYLGTFLTTGYDNAVHPGTGEQQNHLYVSEDGETSLTFEGYDNKEDVPTEGHAVIVAAFRDDEGNVFYQRLPAESASATGFYEEALGDWDKLDDDRMRVNDRKQQKSIIDSYNKETLQAQRNVYQSMENDLHVDLNDRFLRFTPNVYGGVLAALTSAKLSQSGIKSEEYGPKWEAVFNQYRNKITQHIDEDLEFFARLRSAKNNKEAMDVWSKELLDEFGTQELVDMFVKYTKQFNPAS